MTTNCIATNCERISRTGDAPEGPIIANIDGASYEFWAPADWWEWRNNTAVRKIGNETVAVTALAVYCHQDMNGVQTWYAFPVGGDRALHQKLMQVDRVGAKSALMILARNPYRELYALLRAGDREGFAKLKGLGGKTGATIINHLFKDAPPAKAGPSSIKLDVDAVAALVALGYKAVHAKELVGKAMQALPGAATEVIVAAALKR